MTTQEIPCAQPGPLPCPFCGDSRAHVTSSGVGVVYVECAECGACAGSSDDEAGAIDAWSTRHTLASIPAPEGGAAGWPSGIDIADELDSLLPISMGYSTRAAVEQWWRDLVARKLSKLAAPAPQAALLNLTPVIEWLENGCDPKEAAKELRIYQATAAAPAPRATPADPLAQLAAEQKPLPPEFAQVIHDNLWELAGVTPAPQDDALHAFKNFHQRLCERFGYFHDEQDWQRDLCSLEEHIAGYLKLALAAQAPQALAANWISIYEQAPEIGQDCIVWIDSSLWATAPYATTDKWDEQREDPLGMGGPTIPVGPGWDENPDAQITHWMPLPAAPQTKEPKA